MGACATYKDNQDWNLNAAQKMLRARYNELIDNNTITLADGTKITTMSGTVMRHGVTAHNETLRFTGGLKYNENDNTFMYGEAVVAGLHEAGTITVPTLVNTLTQDREYLLKLAARGNVYASDTDAGAKQGTTTETVEGLTNNPSKIKEFMQKLRDADRSTISDEHYNRLMSIVDKYIGGPGQKIPVLVTKLMEAADKNGGSIDLAKKEIKLFRGAPGSAKSMPEVYLHEYLHAVFELAKNVNSVEYRELSYELDLERAKILGVLDVATLAELGETSEYEAQKILDYISIEKNAGIEFKVMAVTNEPLVKAIEKLKSRGNNLKLAKSETWFDKLVDKIIAMFEATMELAGRQVGTHTKYSETIAAHLLALSKLNEKSVKDMDKSITGKVGEVWENANEKSGLLLNKLLNKWTKEGKEIPDLYKQIVQATGAKKVWLIGKNFKYIMQDRTIGKAVRTMLAESLHMSPQGFIQTQFRHMSKQTSYERISEVKINMSSHIDTLKENAGTTIQALIQGAFNDKKHKTEDLEVMKRALLDTDMRVFAGDGLEHIKNMFADTDARKAEIVKLEEGLSNFAMGQAKWLGWYMVSGKADYGQLMNAELIDSENVDKVDKLASLYAVEYSDASTNAEMVRLIEEEPDGVENILALAEDYVQQSKRIYNKYTAHKGYVKNIFRTDRDMQYVSRKERNILLKKGYIEAGVQYRSVVDPIRGNNTDGYRKVYLMVNDVGEASRYHRTALRLTDHTTKSVDIKPGKAVAASMLVSRRRMEDRRVDPRNAVKQSIVAVYAEDGKLRGYNYAVAKDMQDKYKVRLDSISGVLGGMYTELRDQEATLAHNDELLDVMARDAVNNIGRNGEKWNNVGSAKNFEKYEMLESGSKNKELAELYRKLPTAFKHRIEKEYGGQLPVRSNLMYNFLGFKELSVADALPASEGYTKIKTALKVGESIWQEVVGIAKADIVIRTVAVLVGNVVSNTAAGIVEGVSPYKMLKLQTEGLKYIVQYVKLNKELRKLEVKGRIGKLSKVGVRRMHAIKGALKSSPVADLVDSGHFTAIVEDLGADDKQSNNKIRGWLDANVDKLPSFMQTAGHYMYLSNKTAPFRAMTRATQYSDFIAKYALKKVLDGNKPSKLFVEQHSKDKYMEVTTKVAKRMNLPVPLDVLLEKPSEATYQEWLAKEWKISNMNKITDTFIHYGAADSKAVEYANKMGLVMFTKYFNRIQRVIKNATLANPLNTAALLFADWMSTDHISDIMDQQFMVKDLSSMVPGPSNIIEHAVTPTMYELLTGQLKL